MPERNFEVTWTMPIFVDPEEDLEEGETLEAHLASLAYGFITDPEGIATILVIREQVKDYITDDPPLQTVVVDAEPIWRHGKKDVDMVSGERLPIHREEK